MNHSLLALEGRMVDDDSLREHARKAIQAGHMPSRLPDKVWAGAATQGRCAVCGEPMADGVELELVFTDEWHAAEKSCSVHQACLKAFECAVEGLPSPSGINGERNGHRRSVMDTVEPPE